MNKQPKNKIEATKRAEFIIDNWDTMSITKIADNLGISRQSVYNWKERLKSRGIMLGRKNQPDWEHLKKEWNDVQKYTNDVVKEIESNKKYEYEKEKLKELDWTLVNRDIDKTTLKLLRGFTLNLIDEMRNKFLKQIK